MDRNNNPWRSEYISSTRVEARNIEQAATIDCGSIAMSMTVYDTCFLGLLMIELNGLPGAQDCRVPVCLSEGSLSQTYLILN